MLTAKSLTRSGTKSGIIEKEVAFFAFDSSVRAVPTLKKMPTELCPWRSLISCVPVRAGLITRLPLNSTMRLWHFQSLWVRSRMGLL